MGILVAGFGSACVPFPAAFPPAKVSIVGGGAAGDELAGAAQLRLGLHAGSFGEWAYDRGFDAGVGFVHEAVLDGAFVPGRGGVDGPYLDFGIRTWRDRIKRDGMLRSYLFGTGEMLTYDGSEWGGGFTLGATLEIVSLSSRMFSTVSDEGTVLVGWAHGETSVGITLSGGWRTIAGEPYGVLLAGLTVRLPAILGVFLVPIDP